MAVKQLFRMYALYIRMDWQFLMRDRRNALFTMVCECICTLSSILGIALMAIRFEGIGALSADEILWMLAFFTLSDGFTFMMMGGNNTVHVSRRVGRGQIDHMLLQPCPLPVQLMTEGVMPFTGSGSFWAGVALTGYATRRLGLAITPEWILMLIGYTLARMAVTVGLCYLAGALAFYRPVSCEEISTLVAQSLNTAGIVPLAGMPPLLTLLFTTVLPVGLMAYVPSMILLHKTRGAGAMLWPFALGAGLLAAATLCFRKGIRYYARTGCPRYKDLGFRR